MIYTRVIKRETLSIAWEAGKRRRVVVSIDPIAGVVSFRLKGTRRTYSLPASYLWQHVVAKTVSLEKARKVKERKRDRKVNRGMLRIGGAP